MAVTAAFVGLGGGAADGDPYVLSSQTLSAGTDFIVVAISYYDATSNDVVSVKWNTTETFTLMQKGSDPDNSCWIFGLKDPTITTASIDVDLNATTEEGPCISLIELANVGGTTVATAIADLSVDTTATTNSSGSLTSETNGLGIAACYNFEGSGDNDATTLITSGSGQTQLAEFSREGNAPDTCSQQFDTKPGAATVTMGFSDMGNAIGNYITLKLAVAGGGTHPVNPLGHPLMGLFGGPI